MIIQTKVQLIEQQQNIMQKQQIRARKGDINNYNIQAQIGHGASGVCYKAISKLDGSICAIKKISINSIKGNSLKMALREVQMLKQLNHPNIIKYLQSFVEDSYLCIVMQYAQKGDLHAMLKRKKIKQQTYSQSEIWQMGRQLTQALRYLHSKNIVHRDFKTLNIFIGQKNNLLLGDLGVSKIIKNDMGLYSRVGTPLYLAPQIIKYQKYDYKADIWGLGCVMYAISALSHPFQGKNIISLGQNILHNQPKLIPNYSNELNSFLRCLLQKNPGKRPDAKTILIQYFSPQIQKQRNSLQLMRNTDKLEIGKNQVKQKQIKYNTFLDSSNINKISKAFPVYTNEMLVKEKKSSIKNLNNQQKVFINDETIILQPSSIKIEAHQQKTRIRAMFNHPRAKIVSNRLNEAKPIQKQMSNMNDNSVQLYKFEPKAINCSNYHLSSRYKPQSQKLQTETHEQIQKQIQNNRIVHNNRIVQSAKSKPKPDNSFQRQQYSSCQKIQKNFVVSVNRMFFQLNAEEKKAPLRPKSGLGRKTMIGNNQIRYIRRVESSNQANISNTRTQILRKPEMIII